MKIIINKSKWNGIAFFIFYFDRIVLCPTYLTNQYWWMQSGSKCKKSKSLLALALRQLGFFIIMNPDSYNCQQRWYIKPNVVSLPLCSEHFLSSVFASNVCTICVCPVSRLANQTVRLRSWFHFDQHPRQSICYAHMVVIIKSEREMGRGNNM